MRARHLSATFALLVLQSCSSPPPAETQRIVAHYAPLCTPASDHSGSRTIEIRALGDFDPSNTTVAFLDEGASEQPLQIPAQTQAVELRSVGPDPLWGVASIQPPQATDALLLPALQPCPLAVSSNAGTQLDSGTAIGLSEPRWLLAAGADDATGSRAKRAQLIDLSTGENVPLGATRMTRARAFATITPFAGGMLVAGGQDPVHGTVHDDAEVFDLSSQRFSDSTSLVALVEPRTKHAALSLNASSVLLVGGAGSDGTALASLEMVTSQGAQPAAVNLAEPRIEPTALRLDNDRIVVGGGYTEVTDTQSPVDLVEWFSADASQRIDGVAIDPPALGRAFIATVGGGVLAVGGCDAAGIPLVGVWWIDQQLQIAQLPDLPSEAQSCAPQLIAASVGQPFLLSNGALWRFNPWSGQFDPSGIDLATPQGEQLVHARAIDAGLFTWLELGANASRVLGLRHDTRNLYSADITPFLLTDNSRLAPNAWATPESYARYADDQRLEMLSGSAEVWITDTRYADFALEFTVEDGPTPLVLLGTQAFGSGSCAWPKPAPKDGVYRLERTARQLRLHSGSAQQTCSLRTSERVAVGLRGRSAPLRISRLAITRASAP